MQIKVNFLLKIFQINLDTRCIYIYVFCKRLFNTDNKLFNTSNNNQLSPVFQVPAAQSILAMSASAIAVYSLLSSVYTVNSSIAAKIDSLLIISVIISSILISGILNLILIIS